MAKLRNHQACDKVALIRRHLVDGVPVSDLCDELNIKPTQYYTWQKQFFENGELAFQRHGKNKQQSRNHDQKKIAALEEKLKKRDEVVAELLQEHVQLKKEFGEL